MGATKHIKMALLDKDKTIKDLHDAVKKDDNSPLQSLYNQFNRDTWKFSDVEKIAGKTLIEWLYFPINMNYASGQRVFIIDGAPAAHPLRTFLGNELLGLLLI